MGYTEFFINRIEWEEGFSQNPSKAIISLPDYLVLSGPEDFEEDSEDRDWDDDDGDNYEPSDEAIAAWEADFDREVFRILEETYGGQVLKIGGYRPAEPDDRHLVLTK